MYLATWQRTGLKESANKSAQKTKRRPPAIYLAQCTCQLGSRVTSGWHRGERHADGVTQKGQHAVYGRFADGGHMQAGQGYKAEAYKGWCLQ